MYNTNNTNNINIDTNSEEMNMVREDIAEEFSNYECGLDTYEDEDGNMRPQGFHVEKESLETSFLYKGEFTDEENILNNLEMDEDTFLHCMEIAGLIKEDLRPIEEELYHDELDYQVTEDQEELKRELAEHKDLKDRFNALLDMQDRLEKGMKMIQQASKDYFQVQANYNHLKEVGAPWPVRQEAYKLYGDAFKYRAKLWNHWNKLRDQMNNEIIGEQKILWVWYFQLMDLDMPMYWTTADAEDIDNQVDLWNTGREHTECMLEQDEHEKVYEGQTWHSIEMEIAKKSLPAPKNIHQQDDGYMDALIESMF